MGQVDLPRGLERIRVHERDHQYVLRGSESRTLTTVGAFRVVPAGDEPRAGANVVLMPSQRTQEAS